MPTISSDLNLASIDLPRTIKRALLLELAHRNLPQTYGNAARIRGRDLRRYVDVGPATAARWDVFRAENPSGCADQQFTRLELHNLLVTFESQAIKLYDMQRADTDPEDFLGIDRDATIAKLRSELRQTQERILAYADKD